MRGVLQGRFGPKKLPPMSKWREELAAKTSENETLYREYAALKDETAKTEKIKKGAAEIMRTETPERAVTRARGVEL